MSDFDLRQLQREAQQGNRDALIHLVYAQHRAGQEPELPFFMRLYTAEPFSSLGIPLQPHPKGRFIPDLSDIEYGTFFNHFLVNGRDAELVLARSVRSEMPHTPEEFPPQFQNLTPEHYDHIEEDFAQGFHLLENIIPLGTLTLNQLYHPWQYDKSLIEEYEDPPEFPQHPVTVLVKKSGEEPHVFHVKTTPTFVAELLGETRWASQPLPWLGPDIRMYVSELPHDEADPNFGLQIPLPTNVTPEARKRLLGMIEEGVADPGVLAFMEPRVETIYGTAVFINTSVPEYDEIPWNSLPWPWNEIAQEDPDREWPAALEHTSLSDKDIVQIKTALVPIPIRLPIPATHFVILPDQGAKIYELEACDKCEEPALGQNSLNIKANRAELIATGLIEQKKLPPELGWSEEFDGAVCDSCYE